MSYFCSPKARELSSVGSEHRPYKAGVVGSSPTVPTTKKPLKISGFFYSFMSGMLFDDNFLGLHAVVADQTKNVDTWAEVHVLFTIAIDGFARKNMSQNINDLNDGIVLAVDFERVAAAISKTLEVFLVAIG